MDKGQLSKWINIILGVLLVTSISTALIYNRELKNIKFENEKLVADKNHEESILHEEAAFMETVEALKLQAKAINAISSGVEQSDAIRDLEEMLKSIFSSEYVDQLTNDTFTSDDFGLAFTDYPLQNGMIRSIQYILKDNKDGIIRSEKRFFLQYIGETTFFSDVQSIYTDYDLNDDQFQVFEQGDSCFAFFVSSGFEYNTFSSSKMIKDYYVTIYTLGEQEFIVKQNVDIPLKIALGGNFELVQEEDMIKGIITDNLSGLECIFNSLELTFELPDTSLESKSVDYEIPGLLLGLSNPNGDIRTLFIRKEGDKIRTDSYNGQIIIAKQNKLFTIKPYVFYEDFYESGSAYRTGNVDIKKLLFMPLGADISKDYSINSEYNEGWEFYQIKDIPLFIGEDYICYIQYSYYSGGGSYKESVSNIRFDKLNNLADFKFDGWITPNFDETNLADLIYGEKAEELYKKNVSTYGGTLQPYVDFSELAIKRNLGKWSIMLPIIEEYYHPGNGSYSKNITDFAAYDNDVPNLLAANGEMIELGGWDNWEAKDLFRLPGSQVDLVQNDYSIGIRCSEESLSDFDLSIPVNLDEYIVSICFADNHKQSDWIRELSNIN